ncbi:MAG: hypothetical protein ACYS1A_00360 [Planctomycetota bacterium]
MPKEQLISLILLVLSPGMVFSAIEGDKAEIFAGQDLHLAGTEIISYQSSTGEHILVLTSGFSMSIGAEKFSSDEAVVWLESQTTRFRGRIRVDYRTKAYLTGNVSVEKTRKVLTVDLGQTMVENGQSMVVRFDVTGEIFVTADKREVRDPQGLELYKKAFAALQPGWVGAELAVWPEAKVPEIVEKKKEPELKKKTELKAKKEQPKAPVKKAVVTKPKRPVVEFRYPVRFAPASEEPLKIESAPAKDEDIATVIGRLYVWQKQDERGGLLELQADNAVVFYSRDKSKSGRERAEETEDILSGDTSWKAIYLTGDVVMTEGQRTIRADEIYYDFEEKKALVINAVMRTFDVSRGIPIYVRAAKLQRVAENKFAADNVILTSSEFYLPQISSSASRMIITDTTTIDAQQAEVSDSSYDAQMYDVRLKIGEQTVFYWPYVRSNLERPDIPLKSMRAGHDSILGTFVETRWFLSRLLGLKEPEKTDNTLGLHYYGKRGFASEVEIDYEREDYFGRLLGFVISDRGRDRLGRASSRRNIEPDSELRGRFHWQHRQFLPYNWQLTAETSYISDERFLEGYYRDKFDAGKEQETIVQLKRLEDNWALSLLGKGRINEFADELEEMPGVEFHLTGESIFDDKFTLYSDSEFGRMQQRIGNTAPMIAVDDEQFSFASHRTELDMPIRADSFKVVPFVAGTFGYDDRSGFRTTLINGSNTGSYGQSNIWIGEAGVRVGTQFSKVYPKIKSQLWDLNQLRHIIKPQFTGVFYVESDDVVEQRDTFNFAVSQRLQTKRGVGQKQRTVDWMRLDIDVTVLEDPSTAGAAGPDRFIWNRSMVPLRVLSAPDIFNGDLNGSGLRRFEMFGPTRNYFGADYLWRMSDTTAVLSDINYDLLSGVVQQFNFGFSRMRWPNLSYYIGSRYLRRVNVLGEQGSNAFVFAATYVLDPRYTVVFSQQFDFDYGANMQSEMTLIRRYHRMYCGFTYSMDGSLDRQAIVFSIWPQGIPEMGIGQRKFTGQSGY